MSTVVGYLKNVYAELEKVSWPSQRVATYLTALVIAVSLLIAAYLGLFDFILARALNQFVI